ncbi:type VI secretion system protein ImpJ [Paraburkholderia sp. RAU2J]|uniref:type VI secretion system baseplate subunit TssK n=1 Tax=Paraburkholderia sp. RAU2J TaxID=1938810 RepID=UPI000EB5B8C3|nr:type VI secretion system baseplate subunit TssK [Paraburkholderia sp. RAU2J]RKT20969.1 type VI secretion system protein ImpJ [Paraburkholderia sp. RAU2J]
MSWNNKVIWSEGMFLQPQHLQQHDRHLQAQLEGRAAPLRAYGWGFTSLEIDDALLKLGKLSLRSAAGVLPDGTPFNLPADDALPEPLEIPDGISNLLVVLALPVRRPGAGESGGAERPDNPARYRIDEFDVHDSNDRDAVTTLMQVGKLRLRLAFESDVANAHACLGVAKIVERVADSRVLLDDAYCAPCLDLRVAGRLARFTTELNGLLQQRGETLAARLAQPHAAGAAEISDFLLLQTINRAQPLIGHFMSMSGLHPESLFQETVQLAGELATFGQHERRPPVFPAYRHDRLAETFTPVIDALRLALSRVADPQVVPVPLDERRYGLRVARVADRALFGSATFVLAVRAQMPADALQASFPAQLKIGAIEHIRDLVNLQLPGIGLRALPVAPRQLPFHAGFSYFELDDSNDAWQNLASSAGMALYVAGDFPALTMECWAIRR